MTDTLEPTAAPTTEPSTDPRADATEAGIGTVGVLVCTYDDVRFPLLTAALDSLGRQTRCPDEILVMVDNGHDLAERVRVLCDSVLPGRVRVECVGENRGVSVARTRGAAAMTTDWVVFLDDDAVVDPTWLERLVSPLGPEGVLGTSGRFLPKFEAPRPAWLPDEYLWAYGCSYLGMPETTSRARNFFGGAATVRREQFLALGGFSEAIGHQGGFVGGGEESLYCQQATRETGGWFVYEPSAVAHHVVPLSRLSLGYLLKRCFSEGVMKHRLARLNGAGSLDDEKSFARELPRCVLGHLMRLRPARAFGVVAASLAVIAGLGYARLLDLRSSRT